MSNTEFGNFAGLLLILFAAAHALGYLFARLHQPRVVGEILAGVVLGPSILGRFAPHLGIGLSAGANPKHEIALSFLYNLGLLLLMFASGAETKGLFGREDRREVAWLGIVGTGIPFVAAMLLAPCFPLGMLAGPLNLRTPLILVIGIAVAVTSIPVISKILHDLGILHTRFARLILGVAVLEDICLWAVLAIATALASAGALPQNKIFAHIVATLLFFGLGLSVFPQLLRRITGASWNALSKQNPVAYLFAILLGYTAVAALLDVSLVFAAFLAGLAAVGDQEHLRDALHTLSRISFSVFIPIYFALVGYKLDFGRSFSFGMLLVFLSLAAMVKLCSAGLGARLAGFNWLEAANLSVALNARGGPGIVLASVAFEAKIISASFYTTLVLVAVLTSQAAGAWLGFVMRRGWPLLVNETNGQVPQITAIETKSAA
jgi:Kef-type K+ transport system membrane component KefB